MPDEAATPVHEFDLAIAGAYDWASMIGWLAQRAIPGVDAVDGQVYRRHGPTEDGVGDVEVRHVPEARALVVRVTHPSVTVVHAVRASVRRVFDVDRDLEAMRQALGGDAFMASLLDRHVGLRVPGGWTPFELAVRAVLGQQVTIGAARMLAAHLVQLCGTRGFPSPACVLGTDLSPLRMPGARKATLHALADATAQQPDLFRTGDPLEVSIARLRAVRGLGDWTAHYIALRALRADDAFPASDVGLLRGAARETAARPSPRALLARAETWRPHRAYAAQLLWAEDARGSSGNAANAANASNAANAGNAGMRECRGQQS